MSDTPTYLNAEGRLDREAMVNGHLDRSDGTGPDYESDCLCQTIGYVTALTVSQEGARDEVWFTLHIYADHVLDMQCCINLDVGSTVAMGQLQDLRDALRAGLDLAVEVEFNFSHAPSEDPEYGEIAFLWVYQVAVVRADSVARSGDAKGTRRSASSPVEPVSVKERYSSSNYYYPGTSQVQWYVHAKGA